MSFSEIEFIESLVRFDGYDLNEEQLTELLIADEENFVQRLHIGFMFIVENINEDINMTFLRIINDIVSENKLFYYTKEKEQELNRILATENPIDKIIALYQYITKGELFHDEKETTAILFISALLIQYQIGVLRVPKNLYDIFNELLEEDHQILSDFILKFCLDTSLFS